MALQTDSIRKFGKFALDFWTNERTPVGNVCARGCLLVRRTPGPWQIGDFARAKDTLSVIIVEIDTRIYKTYPELDLTIVPQLSERYFEFNQ